MTIHFLPIGDKAPAFFDSKSPEMFSWWISDDGAWAINESCFHTLYEYLLKPPNRFVLSLVEEKQVNHLQLATINDISVIKADTPLNFTINNIPHQYTIYELQRAIRPSKDQQDKDNLAGKSPGVQALLRFLGEPPMREEEKAKVGRPEKSTVASEKDVKKVIARSGYKD